MDSVCRHHTCFRAHSSVAHQWHSLAVLPQTQVIVRSKPTPTNPWRLCPSQNYRGGRPVPSTECCPGYQVSRSPSCTRSHLCCCAPFMSRADAGAKLMPCFYFFFNIYFETETAQVREGQREREREEDRESQAGSALSARSPMRSSDPQTDLTQDLSGHQELEA